MRLFKKNKKPKHELQRLDLDAPADDTNRGLDRGARQVINLLNYTKTSGSAYDGVRYDVGYHSLSLGDQKFQGQRDPEQRFSSVPYDFTGKTVLDFGCNQGGMVMHHADKLRWGMGVDYDSRMVNVANKLSAYKGLDNTHFYVFNLEEEPLDLIRDLVPDEQVDICFLLSVCMWIENWRDVIKFCRGLAPAMMFESNGSVEQQQEQIDQLHALYDNVELCAATSEDDPKQKKRQLLLCQST